MRRWRGELRVCSPEVFDVYFQFGVAPEALRRAELDELVAVAAKQPEIAAEILKEASLVKRPSGTSKAREYLERLHDLESEVSQESAIGLIRALFDKGDELLSPEDEQGGFVGLPNCWRLRFAINHLLERVPDEARPALLLDVAAKGKAIGLISDIIGTRWVSCETG